MENIEAGSDFVLTDAGELAWLRGYYFQRTGWDDEGLSPKMPDLPNDPLVYVEVGQTCPLAKCQDAERHLVLILTAAYFDTREDAYSESQVQEMSIDVYSEQWDLLCRIPTGKLPAIKKVYCGPVGQRFELAEDGFVLLDKGGNGIRYVDSLPTE